MIKGKSIEKKFISINDIKNCSRFNNYKNFEILGKGGNAVAFKAEHKITNQIVVIKVYAKFEKNTEKIREKHLFEIKKNADFRLTKYQAVVFDAGIISVNNNEYLYSIMNYLDGITLKEWINRRKNYKNSKVQVKVQIEKNATLGFLYSCYNLIENDFREIIHGDINDGNVIFLNQKDYAVGSDEFLKYCTINGDYLVPTVVELIDYGTSKWKCTKPERGIERDLSFIMNNTEKILLSYPIKDFIDFNAISSETDGDNGQLQRNHLIVDLIRIILSIDFLDNLYLIEGSEKENEEWLNRIWYGEFKWEDKFYFNRFINLNYWAPLKKPSCGKYIKEKEIINYFNEKKEKNYEIIFKEKFLYTQFLVKNNIRR